MQLAAIIALWQENLADWWNGFVIGDTYGKDWLLFVGGLAFFGVVSYALYYMLLDSLVRADWHPANLRRLLWAFFFFVSVCWFMYAFAAAFGFYVMLVMLVIWLLLSLAFLITRKQPRPN